MSMTVFPVESIDRRRSRWEEHLDTLTPVESIVSGRRYKREDAFAPLGYGGINGSKLRQLIWLVDRYTTDHPDGGLITGASVLSPQTSMAALVSAHFGLPCLVVLGGTKPETALRHENIAIAAEAGAAFAFEPVGYNPTLQRAVARIAATPFHEKWYRLHYGITTPDDALPEDVEAFHAVGARQTSNIPSTVRTLVMTAGSCNSCVSVLYGIAQRRPAALERIVLLGIGPTRLEWIERRLALIEDASGLPIRSLFARRYHHAPDLARNHDPGGDPPLLIEHYDLHATKWVTYGDRIARTLDGIVMHPTYEGKAVAYLEARPDEFAWFWEARDDVLFWIVGSEPSRAAMIGALRCA